MRKKTNKSPKLRDLKCDNCGRIFQDHISPAEIANSKTHSCSRKCKSAINSRTRLKGKYEPCLECGKPVRRSPSQIIKNQSKYCSRECQHSKSKRISLDGYHIKCVNGKTEKLHRLIFSEYYKIQLNSKDIIHHKNGDKLDNDINNLELMTRGEHNKLHFKKRK